MCAQTAQRLVAAHHQAFVRVIRVGNLDEITRIEQTHLNGACFDQLAYLRAFERCDPRQALMRSQLLHRRLADHAAVPHQHHLLNAKVAL